MNNLFFCINTLNARSKFQIGGTIYLKDGKLAINCSKFIENVSLGNGPAVFMGSHSENASKICHANTFIKNIALVRI